jgi:hypothetical protein
MAMTEDDPAGSNKVHLAVARFRLLAGDTSASLDEIVGCKARGYATAAVRMLEAEALMRLDRVAEAETALRWVLDSAAKAMIRGKIYLFSACLFLSCLVCYICVAHFVYCSIASTTTKRTDSVCARACVA